VDRPIALHLLTQDKSNIQTNKLGNVCRAKNFWSLRYVIVPLNHFVSVTRNYIQHSLDYLAVSLLSAWDDVQIFSLYRSTVFFVHGLVKVDSHIPRTSRRVTHPRIFIYKNQTNAQVTNKSVEPFTTASCFGTSLASGSAEIRRSSEILILQYMSNKMQLYTVYLYLETALHVSGFIFHPS